MLNDIMSNHLCPASYALLSMKPSHIIKCETSLTSVKCNFSTPSNRCKLASDSNWGVGRNSGKGGNSGNTR